MEDEPYEIIYEKGVPLLAFQICSDPKNEENETLFNENQTLQYFDEDDDEKNESLFKTTCPSPQKKHKPRIGKMKKLDKSSDTEDLDFVIVEHAYKSNCRKLYDALGYAYTLRSVSVKEGCSVWRCRHKINYKECGGTIKITSDDKLIIMRNHRHLPDSNISFSHLKETRIEPLKPHSKKRLSSSTLEKMGDGNVSGPQEKECVRSSLKKSSVKCDKMLDYFSESQPMDECDSFPDLLQEEEKKDFDLTKPLSPSPTLPPIESNIAFKVVKNGSITGTHILYDSLGHSYNPVMKTGTTTVWCCQAVCSTDGSQCKVKVSQVGQVFKLVGQHSHSPKRHTLLKINKMKIFSTTNEEEEEESEPLVKRRPSAKVSPAKKIKRERESLGEETVTPPIMSSTDNNENDDSFEFNTKDFSFMVSIEEDDSLKEDPSRLNHRHPQNLNKTAKKKAPSVRAAGPHVSPGVYNEMDFRRLKKIASKVFGETSSSEVLYHAIDRESHDGGSKLYDSRGYFYNIKNNSVAEDMEALTDCKIWFCCSPGDKSSCRARVRQNSSHFTLEKDHSHPPDKEKYLRSLIRMEAVDMVKDPTHFRRSGMSIVKELMESYTFDIPFTINMDHLVRYVNYQKKNFMEHNEISSCRYSFNKKKIPKNFLLDKIESDYKYHVTFATENQLAYLAAATEWYVDEVDLDIAPFTNLFSVHIYTMQEDEPRQVPVFFALLSDRRESDYTQVFSSIKSALNQPPAVTTVIIDLNVPLRRSLVKNFPLSEVKCCDIHWSEDISCKLKEMDLSSFYSDPVAMNYLYQLPLLNLLPRQIFESALREIEEAIKDVSVHDLICYIRETFGEGSLWPPKYWSSFKMPVQINHHEKWRKTVFEQKTSPQELYSLIRSLYLLSESIGDGLRLLSKKKIKKYYLCRSETTLCKVYTEWKSYCREEDGCQRLLEKLASIIHVF